MRSTPCAVSVADHAGWAHFVCVAAESNVPAVIERRRVAAIDDGLPTMPYHHESLTPASSFRHAERRLQVGQSLPQRRRGRLGHPIERQPDAQLVRLLHPFAFDEE